MRTVTLIALLAALGGCQYADIAGDKVVDAINRYCDGTSPLARQALRTEINAKLAASNRSVVVDCGGGVAE